MKPLPVLAMPRFLLLAGDYIFLTGNTPELGSWRTTFQTAVGPMLDPSYPNHTYTVPSAGAGAVNVTWQY